MRISLKALPTGGACRLAKLGVGRGTRPLAGAKAVCMSGILMCSGALASVRTRVISKFSFHCVTKAGRVITDDSGMMSVRLCSLSKRLLSGITSSQVSINKLAGNVCIVGTGLRSKDDISRGVILES